jgi:hypothetical protein
VTVNAIAPVARTRMTEGAFPEMMAAPGGQGEDRFDAMDPANNSPVVAWLASVEAGDVTGRVIEIEGGRITLETGWRHGPAEDIGARWRAADVGPALRKLIAEAPDPEPVYGS